ncbi:MAG: carbohydrate ABC transporter permease [Propionicimonas sp.]
MGALRVSRLSWRRLPVVVLRGLLVVIFVVAALLPLAWLLVSGFKSRTEVLRTPFQFFPDVWLWSNYQAMLEDPAFVRAMLITFGGAVVFSLLSLVINSMAAYVFARLDFAFKRVTWTVTIATMFIPGMAILLTSFLVVAQLRMLDTLAVLVLPASASAAHMFFLRQFYLGLPKSLEEAALIDGCGRFSTFTRIFVPLSGPPFVIVGITSFLAYWNAYVWPTMTISDRNLFQIQQILVALRGTAGRFSDMGMLMAGSMIAALPAILLFLVFQKYIIEGAKLSGVK